MWINWSAIRDWKAIGASARVGRGATRVYGAQSGGKLDLRVLVELRSQSSLISCLLEIESMILVVKNIEPRINSENQTPEADNADEIERQGDDGNIGVQVEAQVAEIVQGDGANIAEEVGGHADEVETSFEPDIFDPRMWDALDSKMIDVLVQKGPKRDLSILKGPKNNLSRRFCATSYTRVLSNGEKYDREWLVYSKELNKVFCFCCKLLRKGPGIGQLANEGFNDWHHTSTRLKEHESGAEHLMNMATWSEIIRNVKEAKYFSVLLDCTPDASHQEQMSLIIRYVDASSGSIEESFLGFLDVNDTTGQGLFDVLKDELKNLGLDIDNAALKNGEHSDIDGKELFVELKLIREFIKESMGPLDILKYLKQLGCFPNAVIAYRILLTVPVTVASAERSFSKLKLLKSYLRSTMTQERLNGLATIALESDVLERIKFEDIIEDFISRNTRRILLFKRT
ncbi:hypothetical protein EJB05_02324, partial [Eragrostis curvula]